MAVLSDFAAWALRQMEIDNYDAAKTLYQYTDTAAVESILSSEKLRLTGLSKLREGDRREVELGIEICQEVFAKRLRTSEVQDAFLERCAQILTWPNFGRMFHCYIGCFTPRFEDAHMWEAFGGNGSGVALGVAPRYFQSDPKANGPPDQNVVIAKVIYGLPRIEAATIKIIEAAERSISKARAVSRHMRDWDAIVTGASATVLTHLIPVCLMAKEEEFWREEEVRAISINTRYPNDQDRTDYRYVDLKRADITDTYYGTSCDLSALKALWREQGMSHAQLLPAKPV